MGQVYTQLRGDNLGFPGLPSSGTFGAHGDQKPIWEADQADKNMFGRTNNILVGYMNKAVLALPDIPMLEGCRKAALDRQVAARAQYKTFPIFGHEAFDAHHHVNYTARRANIFRHEQPIWAMEHFGMDRIRFSQPEELNPAVRNPSSGFFFGKSVAYPSSKNDTYIDFDTRNWGKSGIRVQK